MKVLIIYATNSGGTFLISEIIQKILNKKHSVVVQKAVDTKTEDLTNYDLIIFGSPSWRIAGRGDGFPQESMLALMDRVVGKTFPQTQFAIFGCGDTSYTYFCGAVDQLEKFVMTLHGKKIIDSLRIDGYFFELQKNEQLVKEWAEKLLKLC